MIHQELQCDFTSWTKVDDNELHLTLPPGNACDMAGAIRVAKVILPSVDAIIVLENGCIQVIYYVLDGKWIASLPKAPGQV